MGRANGAIDQALERLRLAYRAAGFPPIRGAGDVERTLAAIRAEIAPLRLTPELERFWRQVDPTTITVGPYPRLMTVDFALDSWTSARDEFPGMYPKILFPVCYESHGYLFVELDNGRGSGGVCFETDPGSPFTLRFPTFAAYVDLLATMIELEEFTRHDEANHSWTDFDPDNRWSDAQAVRLTAAQPLPGFGDAREVPADTRYWPEHWLQADGLTPEMRTARGTDSSVADLLRRASTGTAATGTIRARVTKLAMSGAGCRISVDDGTGTLDLWCPTAVCIYGPVIRREFEFDVVVQADPAEAPDWTAEHRTVQDRAMSHDFEGAQAAAAELHAKAFQTSVAAQATAIRPVD